MMNMIGKNTVSGDLLRGYIERVENIRAQKKQLGADEGAVIAEAKANGFVPAGLRNVLRLRQMKPSDRAEAETLRDMYLHALGMDSEPPLFRAVGLMSVDITAKDSVIEAMKKFVPANGSITVEAGGKPVKLTRDKEGNITITEVIEKPVAPAAASTKPTGKPKADVPDVDDEGAEKLGRAAFSADVAIIDNPFPYGDSRRAKWDEGWRAQSGTDGMGPED